MTVIGQPLNPILNEFLGGSRRIHPPFDKPDTIGMQFRKKEITGQERRKRETNLVGGQERDFPQWGQKR